MKRDRRREIDYGLPVTSNLVSQQLQELRLLDKF